MATVNETLRDEAIAHTVWISRYSTGVANHMVKLLNDSDSELTARLLVAMDRLPTSQFTVSRLEADRMARVVNAVRRGYLLGDTTETIARQVRGIASKGYKDGALQLSRTNAASITKTSVNHLAATARTNFAEANGDVLKGKQWLSTLDNKTTPTCIIRDRLRYTLDNKPVGHKVPYLQGPGKIHFCCRSTETLITKSWRELGIDSDELDEGTRASMDGQVPADTTYLDWLARQSPQRQDEILGPERASLYRSGELKLGEMFTDKGEWISLAHLKALS